MFVTRAAILSLLLAGGDAFAPLNGRGQGISTSIQSSVGVISTPTEVEKPKQDEEKDDEPEKKIDISVPYDATVRLGFDASDKSMPYDEFKVKFLADAVADVIKKQPIDISVPYEATIQLAYEASDRLMSYEDFKPKYLADAVADVIAKKSGAAEMTASPEAAATGETVKEETAKEEASAEEDSAQEITASDDTEVAEEVTASAEEETAVEETTASTEAEAKEEASAEEDSAQEITASDDTALAEEETAVEETTASTEEEKTKETTDSDDITYYKRSVAGENEDKEEEKDDDVEYYKPKRLSQDEIYAWKKKTTEEKAEAEVRQKKKEGRYVLKKNEERAIIVKNMDRSKPKKKPERKKITKETREEKRASKEARKAARKARTGRRVLTISKKTTVSKAKVEAKKEVKMSSDNNGLFAPAVLLTKEILGITELNKLRGKIIKMHTEVIGGLTETAQSEFGNQVMKVLFQLADKNGDGTIDEEELQIALRALGFDFLKEKEIVKIFNKADGDKNGALDFEEWSNAAPPVLKKNLTKLAKKNGHDLGFLAK